MRLLLAVVTATAIAGAPSQITGTPIEQKPATPQQPRETPRPTVVSAEAQTLAEFNQRLKRYSELHKRLESTLPSRSADADPTTIEAHQRGLEKLLKAERKDAKQGDIFTPTTRRVLRQLLAGVLGGGDGAALKATIMDENPGKITLAVNSRYPDDLPVSTVPPQVLAALPKLPEELEYRFIGNRLILLDVHAYTVVDYMDNAFTM
ncbi:MAG TPA: hypothetical protein VGD94_23115 [Vicinamibacterales bacterium]